uniref:Uncharacterized protein n=1 Tax=Arcella intermedia TaxID=1963864 RepID=A0A6B2LHQ4_9EUKA
MKNGNSESNLNDMIESKIVLLGDTGVGKTSIALRFTNDTFQPRTNPTIGASFLMKSMTVDDRKLKLQIWDTAGQERFRSLAPMYYRGASAALLVYDLTSPFSFNKVKEWVNELKINVPDDIIIVVVGNKLDKAQKHREISTETGQEYARSVGAAFFETSAKTKEGIEEAFHSIAQKLIEIQVQKQKAEPQEQSTIKIQQEKTTTQPQSSCPCD